MAERWLRPLGLGLAFLAISVTLPIFAAWDADTYRAAGQRLNDGHLLYALLPGDLPVRLDPPYWDAPLLSPPIIGLVWRPLQSLGSAGMLLWMSTVIAAVLLTAWYVARSWRAVGLILCLMIPIALAATVGNISGLFLAGYVLIWVYRDRPWVGALIGVMGVFKLFPFVFIGFLVARRDRRALVWCLVGSSVTLAISILGAGLQSHLDYIGVALRAMPQPVSLAHETGIRWLSPVLLAAGTLLACLLPERWSYRACVLTIVVGAPVLWWRELAALLALAVPNAADRAEQLEMDLATADPAQR